MPTSTEKDPIYEVVKDCKIARAMYPDFVDNEDGTITIITGYEYRVDVFSEFNSSFKQRYAAKLQQLIPNGVVIGKK